MKLEMILASATSMACRSCLAVRLFLNTGELSQNSVRQDTRESQTRRVPGAVWTSDALPRRRVSA